MSFQTRPPRQAGFTIAEVLVSIFVLAAGTLGAAGMHLSAQRALQRASLQTAALHIAASIADRLRAADRRALSAAVADGYLPLDYQASSGSAGPDANCYASMCNVSGMSAFDFEEWKARVRNELPDGRLQVCPGSDGGPTAEEMRGWNCAAGERAVAIPSLGSRSMVIKIGWREKSSSSRNAPRAPDSGPVVVLAVAHGDR